MKNIDETLRVTVVDLMQAVPELEAAAPPVAELELIIARGFFRPAENEVVAHWFARFLTQRAALWAVINEADAMLDVPLRKLRSKEQWRTFLLGYAAACLLVRQDRFLLSSVAWHTLVQRKLNEAFPEYGIQRKQYRAIFSGYTDPKDALQLYEAMRVAKKHRVDLDGLASDPTLKAIVDDLDHLQSHLEPSKREYLKGLSQFLRHLWTRRGASATQKTVFAVLEGFGRTASRIDPGRDRKQVTESIRDHAAALLQPGDVMVSRHRYALTNYLLPGYWPHASLYIGTPTQRESLGIEVDAAIAGRWCNDKCTLEALRDGVRFRPLSETLNVDCFVILRPSLEPAGIREAIERVVRHEGKGYNFDFDFFTSDKLVCTEVIYRALDGVGSLNLPLTERAGRHTLSAEDLLDFAVDGDVFTPIAIFGYPDDAAGLVTGDRVNSLVRASYRDDAANSGGHSLSTSAPAD